MATPAAAAASAAARTREFVNIARQLPPRLLKFFARYPPAAIRGDKPPTSFQEVAPNPFHTTRNPVTGRVHDPKFSLRRQADLVKLAREHGVESLMPETPKRMDIKIKKRVEFGLRVKGTGIGERVKGHKYERLMPAKMEERRKAMLAMPALIREWKRVGKRKWRKWPR